MLLSFNISALLLIFSFAIFQSLADVPCAPVQTRQCQEETPKATLVGVYIEDCFDEPCLFQKDKNVTMEMDIEFAEDVETLEAQLFALLVPGSPIEWNGINKNACENIVSLKDCPFEAGDYITYGVNLFIPPSFRDVKTDVMFKLVDDKGQTQICWVVAAQLR